MNSPEIRAMADQLTEFHSWFVGHTFTEAEADELWNLKNVLDDFANSAAYKFEQVNEE